jgi:predicted membrane-bound spermidine synthase
MRYERRREPLAPRDRFVRRVLNQFGIVIAVIVASLGIGMAGYRYFERMEWIDAFLNAAMLIGGMGPVDPKLQTASGKIFAGLYALYAGMVVLVAAGILMAPVFHRFIHRFHLEEDARRGRP